MAWIEFDEWHEYEHRHELVGRGTSDVYVTPRRDLAARVLRIEDSGRWEIMTWPGPATNPLVHRQIFDGTLEEAKALATVLAKM